METTFAELVLIVAAITGIYKLLKPLQQRIEGWMLDRLAPHRKRIIDVKSEKE